MTRRPPGKLRVLFVDHTARLGGGEIALIDLLHALDPAVVEPILLLFEEGPLVERLGSKVQIFVLPLESSVAQTSRGSLGWKSILRFRQVWVVVKHIWLVARLVRRLHADLVHTNSLKSDIIGGIAGRLAGRPVLWHLRDRIAPDYLPREVVRVFRLLSRILPSFIIAVSDACLRTIFPASRISARDSSRAAVVYDGLSSAVLDRQSGDTARPSFHLASLSPQIGMVGRIDPWKGHLIFLQAAALVHSEFPSARFQIFGGPLFGEFAYEQQLLEFCHSRGLDPIVTFNGFVSDVPERIEGLDILVHASIIAEPFGLVILEGMARSKPIVATKGGGVPEIVIDGLTGTLIPMGDAPAMATAILSLLRQPELAKQMGESGRQRVEMHFTIAQTARHVEAIYARLLV